MNQQKIIELAKDLLRQDLQTATMVFDMTNLDYTKAYKEYADAIGVTVDELTTQQKQQAVMNAIISKDTIMVNWDNEEPLDGPTEPVMDAMLAMLKEN